MNKFNLLYKIALEKFEILDSLTTFEYKVIDFIVKPGHILQFIFKNEKLIGVNESITISDYTTKYIHRGEYK